MRYNMNRKHIIWALISCIGISALPDSTYAFGETVAGYARIIEPNIAIAGKKTRVVVEITVGKGGIPVGGAIYIGVHHASVWNADYGLFSILQTDDPNGSGYISVKGNTPDNFKSKWYNWAPNESIQRAPGGPPANDWCGTTALIYHQCVQSRVLHTPIQEGEKILVTIGDNGYGVRAPIVAVNHHEFFVAIDDNAKGVFKPINQHPIIDIIAAEPHHLTASAQMVQEVNIPFELQIRAEDKYYNTCKSFRSNVTVRDENGSVLLDKVVLKDGIARVKIVIPAAGPHRLRLNGTGMQGRGEPIIVFAKAPEMRIYFGDIHGHSKVSDGCGEADEYYQFGREEANLDVCALADHWHNDWPLMQSLVRKYYQPGRYVTILAEEGGTETDHVNVYHRTDTGNHSSTFPKSVLQWNQIVRRDYGANEVICGPHHFAYKRGDVEYPWDAWDPNYDRFVEVYSNHGTSEYYGNPRPLSSTDPQKTMQAGLSQGKRFGVIASSDTHVSRPGRSNWLNYKGGLCAFLAPQLTREAIWDALWNYRTYAAGFDRIYIDFKINNMIMGSEIATLGPCTINYEIVGRDDEIEAILIRNNKDYRRDTSSNGIIKVDFKEDTPVGNNFYYLRIIQRNDEQAWSTPIWINRK